MVWRASVHSRSDRAPPRAAQRWKVGDYTARVSLTSASSDFGRLARAYEEMADALASREQHQRLLINELNHRVKNTLATVQAIAGQAFKTGEHPDVRGTFEARLFALAKTHDMPHAGELGRR